MECFLHSASELHRSRCSEPSRNPTLSSKTHVPCLAHTPVTALDKSSKYSLRADPFLAQMSRMNETLTCSSSFGNQEQCSATLVLGADRLLSPSANSLIRPLRSAQTSRYA
jgi:hypothetical protein